MGYQRNEYYWYIMNKISKYKQCTILWYVENLKISHVDSKIVSSVPADIDSEYVNIAKMTITRDKIHKYLGVAIDYSLQGKVILYMVDYIVKMLDELLEDMKGVSETP